MDTELSIEDVEQAVRAALSFLGNASSQCTSQRRLGVLSEYNRDLVSFATESDELFSSATTTLFGPSFPEKAAAHINQMQTLRNSRLSINLPKSQGFSKAPHTRCNEGASHPTRCSVVTSFTPGVARAMEEQSTGSPTNDWNLMHTLIFLQKKLSIMSLCT